MTTTQSKTKAATKMIELAPNQIYLKRPGECNPVQTLVEGSTEWSYYKWEYLNETSLYYKGHYVTSLIPQEAGGWIDEHIQKPPLFWKVSPPARYTSFIEAIRAYEQDSGQLANIDRLNKFAGLEEWCIRQTFTPFRLPVKLELPPSERKRLERLASFDGRTLEEFALEALYKHLAEVEERYVNHEQWKQRQLTAFTESKVEEVGA